MTWLRDPRALRGYRHVVLSPHLDDAALSLGGTIARLTAAGESVVVLTVCGGLPSPFASFSPLARSLAAHAAPTPHAYVTLRRAEDARALAHLGADHYFATILDAIDRIPQHLGNPRHLFAASDARDPGHLAARALMFWVARSAPRAHVWVPLAIGGHVDHRLVFAAAEAMVDPERTTFYEDFPYAASASARRKRLVDLPHLEPETLLIDRWIDARIAAIGEYRSQLWGLFGGRSAMERAVRSQAGTPAIERVWRPRTPRARTKLRTVIRAADTAPALTPRR